jgi:hypothetical protein
MLAVTTVIQIRKCLDCEHIDHSGAFTPGGALSVCGHPNAPDKNKMEGVRDFNDVVTKEIAETIWGPRKLNADFSIPEWCPVKQGFQY